MHQNIIRNSPYLIFLPKLTFIFLTFSEILICRVGLQFWKGGGGPKTLYYDFLTILGKKISKIEKKSWKKWKNDPKINIWQPPIFFYPSAVFMIFEVFLEISLRENLQGDFQIGGTYTFRKPNTFRVIHQKRYRG